MNDSLLVVARRRFYDPGMSRDVGVFLLPQHIDSPRLAGSVAVVIDVLRASTTILTALANGATRVIPCADVSDARSMAAHFPRGEALTGGERGGVKIEGFDLDNSPAAYTADRVAGKTIVFTTTNGTAALLRSRDADRVLIGSLVNRARVADALARDLRPVRLVCAGTDGSVSSEDLLAAGAIAAALEERVGPITSAGDSARIAKDFWDCHASAAESIEVALRQSKGGRNLLDLGLEADIRDAAQVDSIDLVAEYFPQTGRIEPVPGAALRVPYPP